MIARMRCSVASALRDETLAGSAPRGRRWLLIEVPRSWPSKPLDAFGDAAAQALRAAEKGDAYVVLIRRTGHAYDNVVLAAHPKLWRIVDIVAGTQAEGTWRDEAELVDVAQRWADIETPLTDPAQQALLVCCHGKRDQCCAIDGRPVAAALAERWPADTWECSHLGGHRFAPTFVVLPDGACYGRVSRTDAAALVAAHLAGNPSPDHLRGWVDLERWEQAAAVASASATGHRPSTVTSARTDDGWLVTTDGEARTVRAVENPPAQLSCSVTEDKPSTTYLAGP